MLGYGRENVCENLINVKLLDSGKNGNRTDYRRIKYHLFPNIQRAS